MVKQSESWIVLVLFGGGEMDGWPVVLRYTIDRGRRRCVKNALKAAKVKYPTWTEIMAGPAPTGGQMLQ